LDDTDGLDPAAEFDEWKLRELMRIKRDREATYAYVPGLIPHMVSLRC